MERQRIHDREKFEYDEKMLIQARSNNKCCHCGKERYPGFGATIDHFIPLNQGGSNNKVNLIMLCDDCNQEKGEKIIEPEMYLKYLQEPYKQQIIDYWRSYITSFDFFSRKNLLACDQYEFMFYDPIIQKMAKHKNKRKLMEKAAAMRLILKRATWDDIPKLTTYMIKYLKKYDFFQSEETVTNNIYFWFKFGCIYYTEKNGEISSMIPITLFNDYKSCEDDAFNKMLCMFPMVYYASVAGLNTAREILDDIPMFLADEQGLDYLPVVIDTIPGDPILPNIAGLGHKKFCNPNIEGIFGGAAAKYVACSTEFVEASEEERKAMRLKTAQLLNRLPDKRESALNYTKKYKGIDWMNYLLGSGAEETNYEEAIENAKEKMRRENANNSNPAECD